jgi:peptide deformylase
VADEVLQAVDEERDIRADEESAADRARREAALAQVRTLGDPVLRTRASEVARFDEPLREQIERMREIMERALGVGLAATQVGVLARVLVYRVEPDGPIAAVVNPRVEWHGDDTEGAEEGCLSIPGIRVNVDRYVHLRVGGRDESGAPLTIEASGLEARVLQHEIDHLDGVLMLDRTSRQERRDAMRAWRERQPE